MKNRLLIAGIMAIICTLSVPSSSWVASGGWGWGWMLLYPTYDPGSKARTRVSLEPGWNIVSTPQKVARQYYSTSATVDNFVTYVMDQTAQSGWKTMSQAGHDVLMPQYAYFVENKTGQDQTLTLVHKTNLTSAQRMFQRSLTAGWNVIGVTGSGSQNSDYLSSLDGNYTDILDFTTSSGSRIIADTWTQEPSANSLPDFQETKGYGIFIPSNLDEPVLYAGQQDNISVNSGISIKADNEQTDDVSIIEDENYNDKTIAYFNVYNGDNNTTTFNDTLEVDLSGTGTSSLSNLSIVCDDGKLYSSAHASLNSGTYSFDGSIDILAHATISCKINADIQSLWTDTINITVSRQSGGQIINKTHESDLPVSVKDVNFVILHAWIAIDNSLSSWESTLWILEIEANKFNATDPDNGTPLRLTLSGITLNFQKFGNANQSGTVVTDMEIERIGGSYGITKFNSISWTGALNSSGSVYFKLDPSQPDFQIDSEETVYYEIKGNMEMNYDTDDDDWFQFSMNNLNTEGSWAAIIWGTDDDISAGTAQSNSDLRLPYDSIQASKITE